MRIYAEQESITIYGYEFYYEDKKAIADWYKVASRSDCSLEKITSSHLYGRIDSERTGLLVFSLPYEMEWKLFIDGNQVNTISAAGGLLAADIGSGEHTIELKYMPKGFVLGMPISILAFIVLIIFYMKSRKILSISI